MSSPGRPWLNRGSASDDFTPEPAPEPVVGEVIALRQFVLSGGVLHGIVHHQPALDGVNVAVCRADRWPNRRKHPLAATAPVADHSCGFYAYDYPKSWARGARPSRFAATVTATVALSGKVVVCKRGLKAQKMRILGVALPTKSPHVVAAVRANYPAITIASSVSALLALHPLTPISSYAVEDQARRHAGRRRTLRDALRFRMSPTDALTLLLATAALTPTLAMNPAAAICTVMFLVGWLGTYQARDLLTLSGWAAALAASAHFSSSPYTLAGLALPQVLAVGFSVACLNLLAHRRARRRAVAVVEGLGVRPPGVAWIAPPRPAQGPGST